MNDMFKSHLAKLSLALAIAGFAVGGSIARADTQEDMARDLVPAQKHVYDLGVSPGAAKGVDAWVDNHDLIYRIGQHLRVFVRPNETAYITVLNVGSSGRVSVIYPNYYQKDARVRGGQTVAIPANYADWKIEVSGPPGVELIKVIASREPLDLPELQKLARTSQDAPVLSLGRSGEDVARDLVPQLKRPGPGGGNIIGVRSLMVRVLPRNASLPFAGQRLTGTFGLTVRPERPVYRVGESVRVAVAVKQDCRLTLVSLGTSGNAVRLFPNPYQTNGLVRAGQTVIVPAAHAPFELKAEGPAGVDGLVATCRGVNGASLINQGAGNFVRVGDLASVTRDLVAVPTDEQVEQVSGSYIVTN
jgi:hypothetical protein